MDIPFLPSEPHSFKGLSQDRPSEPWTDKAYETAFEENVLVHAQWLRGVAHRLSGSSSDAQDLVQEALKRAWCNFAQFVPGTNGRAWLCTILHHLFIDLCRCRRKERQGQRSLREETSEEPVSFDAEEPAWCRFTVDQLRQALDRLEAEFRVVYRMHALEGCSYSEIAERLQIPKATVGTRLNRARHKLKQLLMSLTSGRETRDE